MKPRLKLAESTTPDRGTLALYEHDGAYSMSFKGQELMHSKACASESLLGQVGVERIGKGASPRILIGGMGLGFTLRGVLESTGPKAVVEVVELYPEVIEWNREHLQSLNGALLDDPRVQVRIEDVGAVIKGAEPKSYDVILLDVDNGPTALVSGSNASLYSRSGLRAIRAALKRNGRVVFWSAGPDPRFLFKLQNPGFSVQAIPAKVHEGAKRGAYMLYVADKVYSGSEADTPKPPERPRFFKGSGKS